MHNIIHSHPKQYHLQYARIATNCRTYLKCNGRDTMVATRGLSLQILLHFCCAYHHDMMSVTAPTMFRVPTLHPGEIMHYTRTARFTHLTAVEKPARWSQALEHKCRRQCRRHHLVCHISSTMLARTYPASLRWTLLSKTTCLPLDTLPS